jgi:hypothetical protein
LILETKALRCTMAQDLAAIEAAEATVLAALAASPPSSCLLHPGAFFLAWQGVLTLAFSGWPPALAAFKASLNAAGVLKSEGAGSKWPKATLAASADGAPPLALEELAALRGLCEAHGAALRRAGAAAAVAVDALSLVRYSRRGLEAAPGAAPPVARLLPLLPPRSGAPPEAAEAARVDATLAEWGGERLASYLEGANRAGSRISTYREASPPGATLVAFLGAGAALDAALDAFQEAVDGAFPGRFVWLDRASLHVTVRGLVW